MELGFWMLSVQLSLKLTRDKLPVNCWHSNSFTLRIHKSRGGKILNNKVVFGVYILRKNLTFA